MDLITPTMLFYFGSTVAQTVVALLAFGAFIGLSRRESVWDLIHPGITSTLITWSKEIEQRDFQKDPDPPTQRITASEFFSDRGAEGLLAECAELRATYGQTSDQNVALRVTAEIGRQFLSINADEYLRRAEDDPTSGEWYLSELQRLGATTIQAEDVWTELTEALSQMIHAGVIAIVLSLALIVFANTATTQCSGAAPFLPFLGFALFIFTVLATAVTFMTAVRLAKACLGGVRIIE